MDARLSSQGNVGAASEGRIMLGSSAEAEMGGINGGESSSAFDVQVDGETLSTLVGMGYDEGKARRALMETNGDIGMAAAILTEAEDDA